MRQEVERSGPGPYIPVTGHPGVKIHHFAVKTLRNPQANLTTDQITALDGTGFSPWVVQQVKDILYYICQPAAPVFIVCRVAQYKSPAMIQPLEQALRLLTNWQMPLLLRALEEGVWFYNVLRPRIYTYIKSLSSELSLCITSKRCDDLIQDQGYAEEVGIWADMAP
ncbi:hypothetical protein AAF712_014493 [Marasmius tenuissimus]|uniref:Uncharacterized protein n=1 Tax=Marasmius tenuissimus TaxID=585030 RepID=A0ABR2ZBU1_9AGAR